MDQTTDEPALKSPLWMVTQEPSLNEFVGYLSEVLASLRDAPGSVHELHFSRRHLGEVRHAFSSMILRGEEKLHRFSEVLCGRFFSSYQISSVVFGEVEANQERFVLTQRISPKDLYSTSDIDLGTRQLAKLRFQTGETWTQASLVANVVEYQPTEPNQMRVHKLISRIKAEEEIWNKVVDEIFGLDALVRRDKQMSHLSRYVKDVFGLKFVVGAAADVQPLHQALVAMRCTTNELALAEAEPGPDTTSLTVLEVKDYLAEEGRKESGWSAIKSVVRWWGKTFEIQIQPLRNYFSEQEHLTHESHAGFRTRREKIRSEIARGLPLFGFYQELLRWLFLNDPTGSAPPPSFPGVTVKLVE